MGKTAIILGATGLTGGLLLKLLLEDEKYTKIKLFSRNSVEIKSDKIEEYLIDLLTLENHKKEFFADEVYCCIGTTASKTKDKQLYKAIDYGIPVSAARIAKENQITTFIVMSSMGANANSTVFYNRIKGLMEKDVLALDISNTTILRPSLIGGDRAEFRLGESFGKGVMKLLNPLFIGSFKKYKMIHPNTIAIAMKILARNQFGQKIFLSNEIEQITKENSNEYRTT